MTGHFLVVGDVMTDVVAAVDDPLALGSDTAARVRTLQGGAGPNVACWLAARGERVTFVGVVGTDPFGREAEAALRAAGVDTRLRLTAEAATGTCVILVSPDGERTMLPDAGANSLLRIEDVPVDLLGAAHHVHVSGYSLLNPGSRGAAEFALRTARTTGARTSVDPASAAPLEAVGGETFRALTAGVDLAFVTLDEAEVLCDSRTPAVIGARLTSTYGEVVVKLGPQGALWCSRADPDGVHVSAAPAPGPVVDTTGAGDAFAAAWLAARSNGERPEPALRTATEAAALVVTRVGARP